MSLKVTANKFISYFKIALEEEIKENKISNPYHNNSTWTKSMQSIYRKIEFMLRKSSTDIFLNSKNSRHSKRDEYARIDATYWLEGESNNLSVCELSEIGIKGNRGIWNLLLAIEHENNREDNLYEVKQLLLVNTPLRVLISYSDFIDAGEMNTFNQFSEKYLNVFMKLEKQSKMADGHEFVFLFGNRSGHIDYLKKIKYQGFIVTKENDSLTSSRIKDIIVEA